MGFLASPWRSGAADSLEARRLIYNDRIARMRKVEYPMLKGKTYLDHGGTTLASKSLMKNFSNEMETTLLANPHSDASNPSASSVIVAETRSRVLDFFKADKEHFDVIFTANATAAIKLVAECFSGLDNGFDYYYHLNCHTSLVGVREMARRSHCLVSDPDTMEWLRHEFESWEPDCGKRTTLFAYPAQSNMNGQRLPLSWAQQLRKSNHHLNSYTLLDVAAYVSTNRLDLSDHTTAPDFIAMSFYKIFGFPDLGALIVRKASSHILEHRKYFGGGTTEMTTVFGERPWVARKEASLHARLEDGTIAIRSILALQCALDVHPQLFGSMDDVSAHTGWLAQKLYKRLTALQHSNGTPVCHIYKASESEYGDAQTQGATIALNVRNSDGSWMGPYTVGSLLRQHGIHIRTGSLCNPAGMAAALGLSPANLKAAYEEGFRCNHEDDVRTGGALFGMARISLGAMSTLQDVETLATFFEKNLIDGGNIAANASTNGYTNSAKMFMGMSVPHRCEKEDTATRTDSPSGDNSLKSVYSVIGKCLGF